MRTVKISWDGDKCTKFDHLWLILLIMCKIFNLTGKLSYETRLQKNINVTRISDEIKCFFLSGKTAYVILPRNKNSEERKGKNASSLCNITFQGPEILLESWVLFLLFFIKQFYVITDWNDSLYYFWKQNNSSFFKINYYVKGKRWQEGYWAAIWGHFPPTWEY